VSKILNTQDTQTRIESFELREIGLLTEQSYK